MKNQLAIFEEYKIRRVYDEVTETWYFSVVDIIQALLDQPDFQTARKYWNKLKERLKKEGSQSVTNCHRLKLEAADGKKYLTDTADPETLLRLIQSVPSPKAEPIKLWLAKVGYERMQEIADPERSLNRARENWRKHGRSGKWIEQRMKGQETRNKLTDYWKNHARRICHPHQYHPSGMGRCFRQRTQGDEAIGYTKPARPHDGSGIDIYRSGGTFHPANRGKRGRDRHARKQIRRENRRRHCQKSQAGTGNQNRKEYRQQRKLSSTGEKTNRMTR